MDMAADIDTAADMDMAGMDTAEVKTHKFTTTV